MPTTPPHEIYDNPRGDLSPPPTSTSPPLPRPNLSASNPQLIFVTTDGADAADVPAFEPLPPEIASADISVPPDGSFVETSSGAAARELKRRYDQYLGVGRDVRSPYAITAFVNQHGRQMYRVGLREMMSAPGAAGQDAGDPPHTKRRSRMSVHSFLPGFKHPVVSPQPAPDVTRSPPTSRRLRKTRSIPNGLSSADGASSQPTPPPSGRPHAHSVSSADAFSAPPTQSPPEGSRTAYGSNNSGSDFFTEVMGWSTTPSSPLGSSTSSVPFRYHPVVSSPSHTHSRSGEIAHPFGPGVSFESPAWRSPTHLITQPALREMQSFESGLTARAEYFPRMSRMSKLSLTGASDEDSRTSTPPPAGSATPPVPSVSPIPSIQEVSDPVPVKLASTTLHSRYSTGLFDVLQTYRGLPTLDKIMLSPQEPTIRLSLRAEESVAPRDDPRFVIWAEVDCEQDSYEEFGANGTDLSASQSGDSRRRMGRSSTLVSVDSASSAAPRESKKMLVAATIERWIAQLTSELDYDELLIFFLTYRTYVSAVDLGHLLICRFHWALGETMTSRDEMVRKIVRVRTFTAIRYWLLTFFEVDFVPNRELRLLFADWLNSLRRDPIMQKHRDALKIVRQLRKVVIDCRDAHIRKLTRVSRKSVERGKSMEPRLAAFTEGPSRPSADSQSRSFNDPEDQDIDFDFDDAIPSGHSSDPSSSMGTNALDLVMMRQPLHMAVLQYGKQNPGAPSSSNATPVSPFPHSSISRVFVNTIGRLGRWKRVLNNRGAAQPPIALGVDVSAFDVEANETGDLLMVKGGVEQYLRMVESGMSALDLSAGAVISPVVQHAPLPQSPQSPASMLRVPLPDVAQTSIVEAEEPEEPSSAPPSYEISEARDSMSSYGSSGSASLPDDTASLRSPGAQDPMPTKHPQDIDVVSIDDVDLSDLSSDENLEVSPPPGLGLRKPTRKLPTRRDFEFVRQSMSTVSSMGIRSRASVASQGSSVTSSDAEQDDEDGAAVNGPIEAWHIEAILDQLSDDEDSGDAEAALRRLEGQINQDKVREKQSKVDQWIQSIHRRQGGRLTRDSDASGSDEDYGQVERRRFSGDSLGMLSPQNGSRRSSIASSSRDPSASEMPSTSATSPRQISLSMLQVNAPHGDAHSDGEALTPLTEARPLVEDAVPLEILQSRVPSRPSTSGGSPHNDNTPQPSAGLPPPPPAVPQQLFLRRHRSFVLNHKAEVIIQHLSMIDRELFLGIDFEEFITPSAAAGHDANVLDWSHFLRERARLKAEGRGGLKTSALTAVRGRFNLLANFVLSEIVLTHPSERSVVINKFIRIAWKAYLMKNHFALVAIIAGLRSDWVAKARRQTYTRISNWEARVLRDLTDWTTSAGDFKHIRQMLDSLVEARTGAQDGPVKSSDGTPATSRSRAASDSKPPTDPACIPFFGVYLAQLHHHSSLPDLIDPTAPHEPVGIDPETNTFEALAHPEVFSTLAPLPASMQLEPLISVHKQRLISGVVKSLVAGQHLAAKRIYQKCLKLRGLDGDTLERALTLFSDKR
ncbi:ras GEF [Epithele typhae]|uniref:ras GEF n=1 Tax=Epithele typhae TaxID=378194 RepID=UPI002008572B|nr:ras GEF [Epithele typhae]KAH9920878.1 ras GEF [Epithele typhae]